MTDIPNWLQSGSGVAGAVISLGSAIAAWRAARHSEKAVNRSSEVSESMLSIERARRHDELDPSRNGIEIALVVNKETTNVELEISIFSSYAYFLHGEIVLSGGGRSIATNEEIIGLHRIGIGNIGSIGDTKGTTTTIKGKFVLRFWPNGMKCNCGIPQCYSDESTLPHWKIERGFEYTKGDLLDVYTYGDPGRVNMENRIILLGQH
jgi:hypothetical protein